MKRVVDVVRVKMAAVCCCSDALCGQLLCQGTSRQLVSFEPLRLLSGFGTIGSYQCDSAIIDVGLQRQPPGLVPNGAKCGDNQVERKR